MQKKVCIESWCLKNYDGVHEYIASLHERVLDVISTILNEIHGLDFSKKQWGLILGQWLGMWFFSLYDRYKRVENLAHTDVCVYGVKNVKATYSNYVQSTALLLNDDRYNAYIYYTICDFLGINIRKIVNKDDSKSKIVRKYFHEIIKLVCNPKKIKSTCFQKENDVC